MDHTDRIREVARQLLPSRLMKGAAIIGQLWREGSRCPTTVPGLGLHSCSTLEKPAAICEAKARWLALWKELHGEPPFGTDPQFGLFELMTDEQFDATGITLSVKVKGVEKPIRVGAKGTFRQTVRDLEALPDEVRGEAAEAVLKIQAVL